MPDAPIGQRFSHVYLDRSQPKQDSTRARRRMAAWIHANIENLVSAVQTEMGVDIAWGTYGPDWDLTISRWELRDVLDVVTVAFGCLNSRSTRAANWVATARRIFDEENLPYSIDDRGGVHYKVDAEFSANVSATVVGLGAPRYANARTEFETAMRALSQAQPDGKEAIRHTFTAAEGIFKLMFPAEVRLDAKAMLRNLEPALQARLADDAVALRASVKMLGSFRDWVDSAHFYRHEAGTEEPSQPPIDMAVLVVSHGASFIRWLILLDAASHV